MKSSHLILFILLASMVTAFVYERSEVQRRRHEFEKEEKAKVLSPKLTSSSVPESKSARDGVVGASRGPTTADQIRNSKPSPFVAHDVVPAKAPGDSTRPSWSKPGQINRSQNPKITEIFPESKGLALPDLLSHLAATPFETAGPVVFEGADENYHEYDQNGLHGEQVQKYFSPDGGLAIEQINYSQDEQIVKRYSPQQSTLAEVSYEYKNQGAVLRFQPDGSVESYHTWDQNNNQVLTRYDARGEPTEVWRWNPDSEWQQIR